MKLCVAKENVARIMDWTAVNLLLKKIEDWISFSRQISGTHLQPTSRRLYI